MTGFYHDASCGSGGDNVPYVMGTARGLRAFILDENGWLRGVTYPQVWTPGENVAQCYVTEPTSTIHMFLQHISSAVGSAVNGRYSVAGYSFPLDGGPSSQPWLEEGFKALPCKGVDRGCSCGFYAYHSSMQAYENRERAVAVVEGYGRVILGTKGFRCQKARIVAVVMPKIVNLAAEKQALFDRYNGYQATLDALPRGAWNWARTTRAIAFTTAITAIMGGIHGSAALPLGLALGFLTGLAIFVETHARHAIRIFERVIHHAMSGVQQQLETLNRNGHWTLRAEKMRRNYPNVPVFGSVAEMLEAFPTTNLGYLVDPKMDHPNS